MPETTGRPSSDGSSEADTGAETGWATEASLPDATGTSDGAAAPRAAKTPTTPTTPKGAGAGSARTTPVVPPKAKAKAKVATAESRAATARAKAVAPNPEWWVPVLVTLLIVGLAWIVVFYITQGLWPVAAFGYWNLVVGFALLISGFAMAMRWR